MSDQPVAEMETQECWELLRSTPIGRVAMTIGDETEVFPINYEVKGDAVYLRTAEGTKLFGIAIGRPVTLEIDGWDDEKGWSVIAKCNAQMLDHQAEIQDADELGLQPWVPTRKNVYVKLVPKKITGRHFTFGPPEEDPWR